MKGFVCIVCAFVLLLYINDPGNAADKNQETANLLTGKFDVSSREARARIASELIQRIIQLKAYLPSLKPEQEKWLKEEKASIRGLRGDAQLAKLFALEKTSEFQLDCFHRGLDEIGASLVCAGKAKASIEEELSCWAEANLELTDSGKYNYAIYLLGAKRTVDFSPAIRSQFALSDGDDPWYGYHMIGRAVQQRLVIPLINRQ